VETETYFRVAFLSTFVREAIHPDSRSMVKEMIESIHVAFKENLKTLAWLDDEAAMWVESKADAIKYFVAYPDGILNPEKVDEIYDGLEIVEGDYEENDLSVTVYDHLESDFRVFKNFGKFYSNTILYLDFYSYGRNASYTRTKNQINILAGNLQKNYLSPDFPRWANYGRLGFNIGHELVHAFDATGKEPF